MPVTLNYLDDGRIALYRLTDPWETHDLTVHYPCDNDYRASVPFTVHTLMDLTDMKRVPAGIMRAGSHAPAWSHPNSGVMVLTGAHLLAQTVAEMIFRLARFSRARFFATEAEGMTHIRSLIEQELSEGSAVDIR